MNTTLLSVHSTMRRPAAEESTSPSPRKVSMPSHTGAGPAGLRLDHAKLGQCRLGIAAPKLDPYSTMYV